MNKDSKKILFVGILITVIIGFLIIWILVEDHKPSHRTGYNSRANKSELNYQSTVGENLI